MCRRHALAITALLFLACCHSLKLALAQSANSWTVPIRVQIDNNRIDLYFGVRANATAGFDVGIDTLAPPPPFAPYAVFAIPVFPNILQADFRGPGNSISWSLRILNTNGATSNIAWNIGQLSASRRLFINDTLDMTKRTSTTFVGDQTVRITSLFVSVNSPPRSALPESFGITNYPNPFSAMTMIEISLPTSRAVDVRILNLLGQEIRTFSHEPMTPGRLTIQWDGRDALGVQAPSGIYFCRLEAQGVSVWRKLYRLR